MRNVLYIAAASALLMYNLSAQMLPADLRAAMDARSAAQHANDEQGWARYTVDDFINTNDNGEVRTKSDMVSRMAARRMNGSRPEEAERIVDEKFRMYGDTVIHTFGGTNMTQGGISKRYSEVWVKQNGVWKSASVHASRVAVQ